MAVSSFETVRATTIILAPFCASSFASSRPMPSEPPVTRTVYIWSVNMERILRLVFLLTLPWTGNLGLLVKPPILSYTSTETKIQKEMPVQMYPRAIDYVQQARETSIGPRE